jgi:hypothetical protein
METLVNWCHWTVKSRNAIKSRLQPQKMLRIERVLMIRTEYFYPSQSFCNQ